MLSSSLVEEIGRLLCAGTMTQVAIARKLNVSRGTVNAIANGRRGLQGRELRTREFPSSVLPERCDVCGHLVERPCHICRTRDELARLRAKRLASRRKSRRLGPFKASLTGIPSSSLIRELRRRAEANSPTDKHALYAVYADEIALWREFTTPRKAK